MSDSDDKSDDLDGSDESESNFKKLLDTTPREFPSRLVLIIFLLATFADEFFEITLEEEAAVLSA